MKKTAKIRLDRFLVERGLVESRERGQAMILAGNVLVNGQKVEKAGALVPDGADIRILGEPMPYVSRGGLKLEAALGEFKITGTGKRGERGGPLGPEGADTRILGEPMPYVSRGGLKLEAALREFKITVTGRTAMDVGASTGGV